MIRNQKLSEMTPKEKVQVGILATKRDKHEEELEKAKALLGKVREEIAHIICERRGRECPGSCIYYNGRGTSCQNEKLDSILSILSSFCLPGKKLTEGEAEKQAEDYRQTLRLNGHHPNRVDTYHAIIQAQYAACSHTIGEILEAMKKEVQDER